jgi:hypothetical protein
MWSAMTSAVGTARWVAAESMLFNDSGSPFRAAVSGSARLLVVTGENASGKSLFVRVMAARLQQTEKVLPVTISIRERTGAGTSEVSGMRRVFMFGDEHEQSTGATSVNVVHNGFKNVDRPSILILDEPEIGLSEAYAQALGTFIGEQAKDVPKQCIGVMVVTHSRPLVGGLIAGYGRRPTHVAVFPVEVPQKAGVTGWLDHVEERSVEDLLALRDVGLERWRKVNKLLKEP